MHILEKLLIILFLVIILFLPGKLNSYKVIILLPRIGIS